MIDLVSDVFLKKYEEEKQMDKLLNEVKDLLETQNEMVVFKDIIDIKTCNMLIL